MNKKMVLSFLIILTWVLGVNLFLGDTYGQTYRLEPVEVVASPSIAGENLTNVSYEYLKGYSAPGITVMGGVNFLF